MSSPTARNALIVIGMWTFSRVIASLLEALIVVIHNPMTFTGDAGTVMMWLWEGFSDDLVAVLAAITLVWVIETRKPLAWVGGLAALYLYGGGLQAWRILTHGWHVPRAHLTTSES
jgi:O-antigen ligase